jgi:hypothetical protein
MVFSRGVNKERKHSRKDDHVLTLNIAQAVRQIYGFCLRNGLLTSMTANPIY